MAKDGFTVQSGLIVILPHILMFSGIAKEDVERLSKIAAVKGTIITPWRVIMTGKDLNTMVNSDAIQKHFALHPTKIFFQREFNTQIG